jgi:Ecdysteroid kinase-like family
MHDVLPNLDHVTPEWLTRVLQDRGHLASGRVAAVHLKATRPTPASLVAHLEVQYTDDAAASVPSQLFLKTSRPDLIAAFPLRGQKEVAFYTRIAATMPDPPVVRCYDAVYAPEAQKFHLVLEDVSASHFQTGWPVPPPQPQCAQAIDCLAKLHAHWWDHASLPQVVGARPTAASVQQLFSGVEHTLPGFLDFLGDRLSGTRCAVYAQALRVAPPLTQRLLAGHGLTLVHGDAHVWNFLFPHNGDTDTVRIIDWEGWRVGLGTMDLAYMMALHWYPERRARLEQALLRRYHAQLLTHGVVGYEWDACWYDYRLAAVRNLFIPMWQWAAKLAPAIWWSHLERAMLAFEDLHCSELL